MQRFFQSRDILLVIFFGLFLALAVNTGYAMPEGQSFLTRTLFKQLDDLHDDLRLSPEQELLWQTARRQSKKTERSIRDNNRDFTRFSERELGSEAPRGCISTGCRGRHRRLAAPTEPTGAPKLRRRDGIG